MNASPVSPEIPLASTAPDPRPASIWRKTDWPRAVPEPFFEVHGNRPVLARWWLLRELRRTLAHEAAQAILDDDRGRGA